ncbi:MAG: ribonuclease E/G [Rhodospirillaceae bacterium]|nr:ribonuclease E/G [Rhodospirillaceae bacterium]
MAGDEVLEIAHVRDAEAQPGAVYRGRIVGTVGDAGTYFVDLGIGPPGLLQTRAAAFDQGRAVAVAVTAAARADKGPKLKLSNASSDAGSPSLLAAAPDPAATWFKSHAASIQQIIATSGATRGLREALDAEAPIEPWRGRGHPFAELGIDAEIDTALSPTVALSGGGSLVIESTAAAVTIDVNAGADSADRANVAAMAATARQLRLRNIAGHILIDVIPTRRRRDLTGELKRALAGDPMKPDVAGWTPLGMIELTRRRVRPALAEVMAAATPYVVLRRAVEDALRTGRPHVRIGVAPATAALLTGPLAAAVAEAASITRGRIEIHPVIDAPADLIRVTSSA